jgi:hypothetical protein
MTRKRIDLRVLPVWLQLMITLSVVFVVVAAAWLVGRDQPVPTWIFTGLAPVLGIIYLVLLIFGIIYRLNKRK